MNRFAAVVALSFLALAAPAGAAVSTPHSGWLWGTPEPQGNSLSALEMQGNTGYAAGGFGTLLKTTDGGSSWATVRTGLRFDFTRIDVIDSDSIVLGSDCALRRTDDGGATYTRLPYTASESRCARRLTAMSFPTSDVGFLLLQDGGVLKTADAGRSFTPVTIPNDPGEATTAIAFATAANGIAANSAGEIFRTTNGGAGWTQEFDAPNRINGLLFSGADAVAVGEASTFLVSGDGGDTWTQQSTGAGANFLDVRCFGSACLITSDRGIVRTPDRGLTYDVVGLGAVAVDFASATRAVAIERSGRSFISDNAGDSWTEIGSRLSVPHLTRVRVTSASVAYAPGWGGALARTSDGGETWTNVGVITSEDVIDVSFPTSALGYALDSTGGLFRTDNAGGTWSVLESPGGAVPQAIFASDASRVLLLGPRGMRRSTDGGETFTRHRDRDVRIRTLVDADRARGAVVAFGPRVIAISTNRGATWRRIIRPTQRAEVRHVDFLTARIGYVVETDGRVYSTTNGGRSWTEVLAVGRASGIQLAFGDRRNGWLALGTSPTTVLRTSDAGRSWRPQVLSSGGNVSIAAGGPRAAFASIGSLGSPALVFTQSGGDAGIGSSLTLSTSTRVITRSQRVTVRGRLSPARAGADVNVYVRSLNGSRWRKLDATVASSGRFTVKRRIRSSSVFVAQWDGDARSAGDGSRALIVTRERRR